MEAREVGVQRRETVVQPQVEQAIRVVLAPLAEHLAVVDLHRRAPQFRVCRQRYDAFDSTGSFDRVVGIVGVGQGPDPLAGVGLRTSWAALFTKPKT